MWPISKCLPQLWIVLVRIHKYVFILNKYAFVTNYVFKNFDPMTTYPALSPNLSTYVHV